ncbi:uncharacterized protein LOC114525522 [Dendronephthya gigantea]|uniref:uncharacterized protein LOC114525522 n=1 Tax=Dendronephthya gigantea TaxID=151771 RepID=UPI00106AB9CF|nr:uncharacterized protein LOC114525522 [Dendronephthya gigantea]
MAMSKGVSVGSMVFGCMLIVTTFISVVSGIVAMSKITRPYAASIGLWGFYFAIPAALSITAGYKKITTLMAVSLGTHILGIIIGIVGTWLAAIFWAILSSRCVFESHRTYRFQQKECYCDHYTASFATKCSDLTTVRNATGAVTIMFALSSIICFVGSIYGCIGTCCSPREPVMVVTAGGLQPPGTVVMTTGTQMTTYPTAQAYPGVVQAQQYPGIQNQQAPPPYSQPPGVIETKLPGSNF